MKPLVHVYIPTFQAVEGKKDFFRQSLESILKQTYQNYKIFISDDGSTDNTLALAQQVGGDRIEVLKKEKSGNLFANWNYCIKHALESPKCEAVALFHQDDNYDPTILEKQMECMHRTGNHVVFTGAQYMDAFNRSLHTTVIPKRICEGVATAEEIFLEVYTKGNSFFICPSALFRKQVFQKVGLFSLDYPNSGDLEMWFRILFQGLRIGFISEPLIRYRLQDAQASARYENVRLTPSDFFNVLEKYRVRVTLNENQKRSFLILKNLDLLNIEIKKSKMGVSFSFSESIKFFSQNSLRELKAALGWPDFLRVLLFRSFFSYLPSFFQTIFISGVDWFTDIKRNMVFGFLLKLKK